MESSAVQRPLEPEEQKVSENIADNKEFRAVDQGEFLLLKVPL